MNDTLNTGLDTNFNLAAKLCEQSYDYDKLIEFLKTGNIIEKQLAALDINEIKSQNDAKILVSNLVGQDGKVREAIAFKVNQLIQKEEFSEFFNSDKIFAIFLEGIMDINGNVCRQICDICTANVDFRQYLTQKLPDKINIILKNIKNLSADEKQYKISKRNFQLYWCLEALFYCLDEINLSEIYQILFQASEFEDYTIREKTAKILGRVGSLTHQKEICNTKNLKLIEKLKNDENYYVRRYLTVFC